MKTFDFIHSLCHLISIFLLLKASVKLWKSRGRFKEYQFWIVLSGAILTACLLVFQISTQGFALQKNVLWTIANSITAYTIMIVANKRYDDIFSLEARAHVDLKLNAFSKDEPDDVFNWVNLGKCEIGKLIVLRCGKIAFKRLPDVGGKRILLVYLQKGAMALHKHLDMDERGYVITGYLYDSVLWTDPVKEGEYFYYPAGLSHDPKVDMYTELFIEFSQIKK